MENKADTTTPEKAEQKDSTQQSPSDTEETRARNMTLDEDPEKWIRDNILAKNMLLKASYMSRLGVKVTESMSKDNVKKLNQLYEEERKKIEQEERELGHDKLKVEKSYSNNEFSINFLIKSDDEMRNNYINKLINMKIMKTAPSKKHQTSNPYFFHD